MAANPQPSPDRKLTIKEVAQLAGFMVSTIRKWQRQGKVPPPSSDGNYSPEYIEILQSHRKNALSNQSKNRWAKLTPEQRTKVAKKRWTPERKKTQSITMRKVRLGLTGLTPKELEEWNTNSKNAADTEEVRKAKARGAEDLWAQRTARLAEKEAAVTAAQAEVEKLTQELAQAKKERAEAKAAAKEALPIAESVRQKLAEPEKHPWMRPREVAAAFGIHEATFYRNVGAYTRLRQNQKSLYSTVSVLEQLKNPPRKK